MFYRPFFTYWAIFIQVVIYIVAIAVYGIAPIGFEETEISGEVSKNLELVRSGPKKIPLKPHQLINNESTSLFINEQFIPKKLSSVVTLKSWFFAFLSNVLISFFILISFLSISFAIVSCYYLKISNLINVCVINNVQWTKYILSNSIYYYTLYINIYSTLY